MKLAQFNMYLGIGQRDGDSDNVTIYGCETLML